MHAHVFDISDAKLCDVMLPDTAIILLAFLYASFSFHYIVQIALIHNVTNPDPNPHFDDILKLSIHSK